MSGIAEAQNYKPRGQQEDDWLCRKCGEWFPYETASAQMWIGIKDGKADGIYQACSSCAKRT